MIAKLLRTAAVATIAVLGASSAQAGDFSVLGDVDAEVMTNAELDAVEGKFIGDLVAMNFGFDNWFNGWALQGVTDWYNNAQAYRAATGFTGTFDIPFNASTISASVNDANAYFHNTFVPFMAHNSAINTNVAGALGQSILGNWNYINPANNVLAWNAPNSFQPALQTLGFQPLTAGGLPSFFGF